MLALVLAMLAAPQLVLPVACRIGDDCLVQNHVDADPSPAARDYMCAGRTYDGHNGVDIRVESVDRQRAGVAVLAAAPGTVLRVRDGAPDRILATAELASVKGSECGNGVVIDHGGGWTTQYCHMANGSISARPGARVAAATPIGRVGLSGATQFPHLHISLRQGNRIVDPFADEAVSGRCGSGRPLWAPGAGLGYRRGAVLNAGFATTPVTLAQAIEAGDAPLPRPDRAAPALVAFIVAIGLEQGDIQRLTLIAPDGSVLASNIAAPLDRDKAQTIVFAGRKRPASGWPAGTYTARFGVERAGGVVVEKAMALNL